MDAMWTEKDNNRLNYLNTRETLSKSEEVELAVLMALLKMEIIRKAA